ncbi:conserved hypothetical protein [Paenibacillus curdlanolyticus YK9]|uniref:Uncharacterized protein n=1 Tax=Paenibacillus curdlanolyticus YK9 TaxID=717606 RepID=E0ICB8_9BACL|nr:hypothetical protein [Paenibacillus curdlanolyticus]EFM09804.1 conserved hypothetical protein [Paenibacillus curdlanolyticus YK9]
MKMSGFIVGGLLGMAAAMYAARKRPGLAAWAVDAAGDMMSSAKNRMISKVVERKMTKWSKGAAHAAPKPSAASADSTAEAWKQLGALVESDPELKRETEAIMASAGSKNDASAAASLTKTH